MDNQEQLDTNVKEFVEEFIRDRKSIEINPGTIDRLCSLAEFYNKLYSESDIGSFIDRASFESTFHINLYIESDLKFIVDLFANHTKSHPFYNGNKRTSFRIFNLFIDIYTPFKLKSGSDIEEYQKDLIQSKISKVEFSQNILNLLEIKKPSLNDKVKLEKLIKRGNVTEVLDSNSNKKPSITLQDLEKDQLFFKLLKKPYFQRDTNSWDISKIDNIINSFIHNMLIPSVILWNSKKDGIFIVDGAHRLSALAAWVNDDYGLDLDYSKHVQFKYYIENKYGNYKKLINAEDISNNDGILNILATKAINIEWIDGDYEIVKSSFIRINEQGVAITNDEKEIIKNDNTSPSILSRSILSYSGGQDSKISNNNSAEKLYDLLFTPLYNKFNTIFPMGGNLYDDFIISRVYNFIKIIDEGVSYNYDELIDRTDSILNLIVNKLQLNNRVYFYGVNYKYKQSALIGITRLLLKLVEDDKLELFISNRAKFEEYLVENPEHIQTIVRKGRYVKKSMNDLEKYYLAVLNYVSTDDDDILKNKFSYLEVKNKTDKMVKIEEKYKGELRALKKCRICGGYINNFQKSDIHKICEGD